MANTKLEMARRCVLDGVKRVARQEALVAELERDHPSSIWAQANAILNLFRKMQAHAEEQFKIEQEQASKN